MKYIYLFIIYLLLCSALMAQEVGLENDSIILPLESISADDICAMPVRNIDEILAEHLGIMANYGELHIHRPCGSEVLYFVDGPDLIESGADSNEDDFADPSPHNINLDLKVDIVDAVELVNHMFYKNDSSDSDMQLYDANGDGEIDARDIDSILKNLYSDEQH